MTPTCATGRTVLVLGLLLFVFAVPALAHTDLVSSTPEAGATVRSRLDEVVLTFGEALAPDGEHAIGVFGPDGETRVDDGTTTSPSAESIATGVTPEVAGTHEVRWVIVADDGDEQRGEFTFDVAEEAVAPITTPSPTDDPTSELPTSEDPTSEDPTEDADASVPTDDGTDVLTPTETPTASALSEEDADSLAGASFPWVPVLVVVLVLGVGAVVIASRR